LEEIRISPEGSIVSRIHTYYSENNGKLSGLEFFDKDGNKILETP
jgi:hypothetical protein